MEGLGEGNDISYLECLRSLANLHRQLGEYDEAYALLMRSLRFSRYYNFDMTNDVVCLIRLLLQTEKNERALEVLVYALMHSDQKGPGLAKLLTHLALAFSPLNADQSPATDAIIEALRTMNDRVRLTPIIAKWTIWENAPFIPNIRSDFNESRNQYT
jgi:tetratricopeptide (TPR) repeat protein